MLHPDSHFYPSWPPKTIEPDVHHTNNRENEQYTYIYKTLSHIIIHRKKNNKTVVLYIHKLNTKSKLTVRQNHLAGNSTTIHCKHVV